MAILDWWNGRMMIDLTNVMLLYWEFTSPPYYFTKAWWRIYSEGSNEDFQTPWLLSELIEAGWRIYASLDWVIVGSGNGLSPVATLSNTVTQLPPVTNVNGNSIEIRLFLLKKMCLKISSAEWRSSCLDLNGSKITNIHVYDAMDKLAV